jgi:hypothetical protein
MYEEIGLSRPLAHDKGYWESTHVVWRKLAGSSDWQLKAVILEGDWTFVTRNSIDFRGPSSSPESHGQYADVELHAGLICLNGPDGMDRNVQLELFERALENLADNADLVNQVLEATLEENDEIHVLR